MVSKHLCNRITDQFRRYQPDPEFNNNKKKQIKPMNNDRQKAILEIITNEMS